jgi:hypothetical protein
MKEKSEDVVAEWVAFGVCRPFLSDVLHKDLVS